MGEGLTKEKVWTPFWIQSTDVCVCVLEGKRGDGQDTSDLNKVLREFQSLLPQTQKNWISPRRRNKREEKG